MTYRTAALRRAALLGLLTMLAAIAVLWCRLPAVHALSFAVYPLDELAGEADEAFIGKVLRLRGSGGEYHRYVLRVDIPLRGELEKSDEIPVNVLQWSDEGVLDKGDTYLMLLSRQDDGGYTIAGVHQGFIKLKNGSAQSRFYSQDEVDRYLERYGLKVKTIYERLVPEDKSPAPFYSVSEATSPGILWTAGAALAVMLVWLFARAVKRRQHAARTADPASLEDDENER